MAAASDPNCNRQFSRRWTGPPLAESKRRPLGERTAPFEIVTSNAVSTRADQAAARAIATAAVRIGRLQHRARVLAGIGQRDAACRLAALAETIIREVFA